MARAENKNSLDDDSMIAYVDEFGNITDTPPDPAAREEINAEDIELGIPKKEKIDTDEVRTGFVSFFNDVKQFGFIRDASTQESIFVHASNTKEPIKENMKVRFEVEQSPRGLSAINVESEKG